MRLVSLGILLATTLAAGPAQALIIEDNLSADQEIPAPTLDGFTPTGMAVVNVNTVTGAIEILGSYSGMTSAVNGSHLHGLTDPSPTAGIILALANSGGMSGTFSGSSTLSAANLAGLLSGRTYLNVHTDVFGKGEIRGNLGTPEIRSRKNEAAEETHVSPPD